MESNSKTKGSGSRGKIRFETDPIVIVETNVDDVTGEVISRTVERILSEGAYDCTVLPNLGKKGRPGFTVRVVCTNDLSQKLAEVLVLETGTLGVKLYSAERWVVPRTMVTVPFRIGTHEENVSVKVAESDSRVIRAKPEVEEVRKISDLTGIPMRQVEDRIRAAYRRSRKISSSD